MTKPLSKIERVEIALAEVRSAQKRACAAIHKAYPVGSEIVWARGGHVQHGVIIGNSDFQSGDSFRVRNHKTGKEYWITFYDVQSAYGRFSSGSSDDA